GDHGRHGRAEPIGPLDPLHPVRRDDDGDTTDPGRVGESIDRPGEERPPEDLRFDLVDTAHPAARPGSDDDDVAELEFVHHPWTASPRATGLAELSPGPRRASGGSTLKVVLVDARLGEDHPPGN